MIALMIALALQDAPPAEPPHLRLSAHLTGVAQCPYAFSAEGPGTWTLSKPPGDQSGEFCRVNSTLGWLPPHGGYTFTVIVRGVHSSGAIDQEAVLIAVPSEEDVS